MDRKKMLLIFNPVAGGGEFVHNLFEIIDRFTRHGFEVTIYPTTAPRDAYQIALNRGADFDCLVCSGGDGTLNEVVDALMLLEKKPLLGYVPSGTTNDFAYSHGLETDVLLGTNTVLQGLPVGIDVGGFQKEYFTYVAAFGLFTDVSYGTPQGMKNMFGHAAYILEGIKKLTAIRDYQCVIECDGEVIEGEFILGMVANSRSIAGFRLPAQMDIRLDDGLFEVIMLRKMENLTEVQEVISVLMGQGHPGSTFLVRSARHVVVTCNEPLDWSVDGEYGGSHTRTEILVHQNAIQMIAPSADI